MVMSPMLPWYVLFDPPLFEMMVLQSNWISKRRLNGTKIVKSWMYWLPFDR